MYACMFTQDGQIDLHRSRVERDTKGGECHGKGEEVLSPDCIYNINTKDHYNPLAIKRLEANHFIISKPAFHFRKSKVILNEENLEFYDNIRP